MPKSIGLLTIHGMGNQEINYYEPFVRLLERRLGQGSWNEIAFESIYYQKILQDNQERTLRRLQTAAPLSWMSLREFLLYALSDAASIEYKAALPGSIYEQIQRIIMNALDQVYQALGQALKPVILVAHSLGSYLISNYIWDAQQERTRYGVWSYPIEDRAPTDEAKEQFQRLQTLRLLFTPGCNIPAFVAGYETIEAINKPNPQFEWLNYYDRHDPLGWPLRPLSPSYAEIVMADHEMNVGGLIGLTPFSHNRYLSDRGFVEAVADEIEGLLS